jgi:hypothetical protein
VPQQKDLKRLVRARMRKTGESYTAARLQLLKKHEPVPDYANLAGMSDASVLKQTGRGWAEWVRVLDAVQAAKKPHREIAEYVSSLGTPDWWTQMVTVGYERIRGLRERGQRRGGLYEAGKSRTFGVPLEALFKAFADARMRRRWLPATIVVRSSAPQKRMRVTWAPDDTVAEFTFMSKGPAKSAVTVTHRKLRDRAAVDAAKQMWGEHLDRLGQLLS